MTTAGLSRAYAVLRQLDTLRTDDILRPFPLFPSSHRAKDSIDAAQGPSDRLSQYQAREARTARHSVESEWAVKSLPSRSASPPHNYTSDISSPSQLKGHEPPEMRRASANSQSRASCLMPPPFSCCNAVPEPQREARAHTHRTYIASNYPSCRPLYSTTPPTSSYTRQLSTAFDNFGPSSRVAVNEHGRTQSSNATHTPYTDHAYMRHSPKSSPHRTHVLSPVVLPAVSSSEVGHIYAHASSTLERCFDRADMHSVLASVAAATRESDPHRHPFSVSASAVRAGASNSISGLRNYKRGTDTNGEAVISSRTVSPPSLQEDDSEQQQRTHRLRCNPESRSDTRNGYGRDPAEELRAITITPSLERILDALQPNSQYNRSGRGEADSPLSPAKAEQSTTDPSRTHQVEGANNTSPTPLHRAYSNALDEHFSPIMSHDSPTSLTREQQHLSTNLSSFYTATGRISNEDNHRPGDNTAQTNVVSSLSLMGRHPYPIPAPLNPAASMEDHVQALNDHEDDAEAEKRRRMPVRDAAFSQKADNQLPASLPREAEVFGDNQSQKNHRNGDEKHRDGEGGSASGDEEWREDNASERSREGNDDVESPQATPRADLRKSRPSSGEEYSSETYEPSLDFTSEHTDALPFLDYLARVNAAAAPVLLKELAAMGDAWATPMKRREEPTKTTAREGSAKKHVVQRDEDEVVDCLALSLLLNKPAALQHIVVPLLLAQLKHALRALRDVESESGDDNRQGEEPYLQHLDENGEQEKQSNEGANKRPAKPPVAAAQAAHFNSVLCAIIGLGSAASTLLAPLLQLLLHLPPPSPSSICDIRLVGLAIRTSGAAGGLRALTRIVEERAEATHVLTAAAYAISTYAYELAGHTSVVCVPAGTLQRSGENVLYRLVPDMKLELPSQSFTDSFTCMERELRPLWSGPSTLFSPASMAAEPTGRHLVHIQSLPPYRATHFVLDAEGARQSLQAFISSDAFCVRRDHPYIMVLLDNALNSSLLCPVIAEPSNERVFKPIWDRMRRALHCVLCSNRAARESEQGRKAALGLQHPLLLYSIQDFFTDEKDMLFAVESALVHALVSRSAPRFQEQALLSLCTLPPEARVHVVQPLTDFFIKVVHRYQLRYATTMRRTRATVHDNNGGSTRSPDDGGGTEGSAEEVVMVAAAIAAGTVCVNALAPESCTSSCIAALVPVFTDLLHTAQWRVRHAACIGLACVGPYTIDPSSVVDLFLSLLTPTGNLSLQANTAVNGGPAYPLQPATIVWCLAQQKQGGVRALLRLLQDAQGSSLVHDWCAFQLADVNVYGACQQVDKADTPDADALLDEMVQVLGKLITMQGIIEENTVLLCVRALAEVLHRADAYVQRNTQGVDSGDVTPRIHGSSLAPISYVLPLQTAELEQEAVTYYKREPRNSCFTVLTSVIEAALLPANVLKALCLYLCKYGGAHGELYVCEMLLESESVAARSAAAFGLRSCGAKVVRSVVLGMNDASFEVRREALDTMDAIGAANVLAVLRHRPAEHRRQVLVALRDSLLQDAGRPVARMAANTVYRTLAGEEQGAAQLLPA